MADYNEILEDQRQKVLSYVKACANESRQNEKVPRRPQNLKNWMYFHGIIDWSHKREGDPRIHLHKLGVAAERTRAKFKQNLMNYDKWIAVEQVVPNPNALVTEHTAKNALTWGLGCCDAKTVLSDAILCACLESRLTLKLGGKYVVAHRYVAQGNTTVKEEKTFWEPDITYLTFEQYLCDTFEPKQKLFEIEELMTDYYRVCSLSADEGETPSAAKPFRYAAVEKLQAFKPREAEEVQKVAEGNTVKMDQNRSRKRVLIQNFFGTVLDEDGEIMEWMNEDGSKVKMENVFCVIGNEEEVLLDPQRIKRYSGRSPFIVADLLRSPGTGRKAIMDAGVDLNEAENELFSLMLTGAMKAVHNVTWYRDDFITNKKDFSGGIKDGDQIGIEGNAPAGAVPMGVVQTGQIPQEVFMMHQTLDRAFAENVISNQLDLSGALPGKQVRSTEIVSANTAISDVFDAMAGDVEDTAIEPLAMEEFYDIIQHVDEIDPDVVKSWFGEDVQKAEQFLAMKPKDRFNEIDGAFKFRGKGLKGLMTNAAKAQAAINYLNTLTANPMMQTQIESQVSVPKICILIAKGLGFDQEEIAPSERERAMIEQKQLIQEKMLAQAQLEGQPNQQSQQPGTPSTGSAPAIQQPGNGMQGMM